MSDQAGEVGAIVDALGVSITTRNGDLPSAAIVLLRVTELDGSTRLSVGWSEGLDWVTRLGMLHAALTTDERESLHTGDE